MKDNYKRQAALLISTLPEVARSECFALHGGTAINMFVHDMPRLSVDIDLTYVAIEDRDSSRAGIIKALSEIDDRIKKIMPNVITLLQEKILKLQISLHGVQIKVEVNQINRGCISEPENLILCEKAQEMFDAFCAINVVPESQLFGGKIIAALDRQHPRDLFDIKQLLVSGDINDAIKTGFIFSLLSSNRPIYELLNPNRTDQHQAYENQFDGMNIEPFSYEEFESTREELFLVINKMLKAQDKDFIISIKRLEPDWSIYDFQKYPSIQWKLENLKKYKANNEKGYNEALMRLVNFLQ
ncbi:MAG: nucleotidyl transferase AbiEii/AbiGii toxin family protein [Bacteroidota bacterium]